MIHLVTGGTGFIGSHLVEELAKNRKDTVIVVDLHDTNQKYIENLRNVKIYHYDINHKRALELIFKRYKIDYIFHLAAQVDVIKSFEDTINSTKTNILGTLNLLDLSVQYKIKKFIFASSGGALYGDKYKTRYPHELDEVDLLSPYACDKYAAEQYIKVYALKYGLKYVILRLANVYGARQANAVIPIFVRYTLNMKQIEVFGDGSQYRDFIYVDDVVKATILSLNATNKCYNIGTAKKTSINSLIKELKSLLSDHIINPNYLSARTGEVKHSVLCNSSAIYDLNWKPRHTLRRGLIKTIYFLKEK